MKFGLPLPSELWTAFHRLYTRFLLEPSLEPVQPALSSLIVPTTDFDELVKKLEIKNVSVSVTGTGYVTFFTVPRDERWELYSIFIEMASGTWTFSSVEILNETGKWAYVWSGAAGTSQLTLAPGLPIPLDKNWAVRIYCGSCTTPGNGAGYLLIKSEKAY